MKTLIVAVAFHFYIARIVSCTTYNSSCGHLGSSSIFYKDAESDEDIWNLGCNIKCRLTEHGIYKDGVIHSSIVDEDFQEHDSIYECIDKFHAVKELNCSHFYELWKCMEKLKEPWSHLVNIKDIEGKCVKDVDCYGKCFYKEMGILKDGIFTSKHTSEDLPHEYRKYIVKSLMYCHKDTNKHYEEDDWYSCKYFQDFDLCIKKQLLIF